MTADNDTSLSVASQLTVKSKLSVIYLLFAIFVLFQMVVNTSISLIEELCNKHWYFYYHLELQKKKSCIISSKKTERFGKDLKKKWFALV